MLTGRLVDVTDAVPGISIQPDVRPMAREFVWDWRIQPRWSVGQEMFKLPPIALNVRFVGFEAIVANGTTNKLPEPAR